MNQESGRIAWTDLTVDNAEEIQDFYCQVVGWQASPVDTDGYSDYNMQRPGGRTPVAGICHALGVNKSLPSIWIMYITVDDLEASARKCEELGGRVLSGPTATGDHGSFCVIQDPPVRSRLSGPGEGVFGSTLPVTEHEC